MTSNLLTIRFHNRHNAIIRVVVNSRALLKGKYQVVLLSVVLLIIAVISIAVGIRFGTTSSDEIEQIGRKERSFFPGRLFPNLRTYLFRLLHQDAAL